MTSFRAERRFVLDVIELSPNQKTDVRGVEVHPYLVEHECGAPPLALRLTVDGKTIAYSGDTEWTDALISAGRDADLFICEAYFYEREVRNHVSFKHYFKTVAQEETRWAKSPKKNRKPSSKSGGRSPRRGRKSSRRGSTRN